MNIFEYTVIFGKSVMKFEQGFCDDEGIDDHEHIPRLIRIRDSVLSVAKDNDATQAEISKIKKTLDDYAKEIWVETWIKQAIESEDDPDLEEERKEASSRYDYLWKKHK